MFDLSHLIISPALAQGMTTPPADIAFGGAVAQDGEWFKYMPLVLVGFIFYMLFFHKKKKG